jgi:putative transposase
MLRVTLSPEQAEEVRALRRDGSLSPAERDRVEMVLLSAEGWSPPKIASHLGYCSATVRTALVSVPSTGLDGLRRKRPGPPKDLARREQVTAALDRLLGQDRTWTAAQLAGALATEGIALSPRQTRKYLTWMDARWRRTVTTLKHKQDPARVDQAERTLATLKKSRPRVASVWGTSMNAASAPASPRR